MNDVRRLNLSIHFLFRFDHLIVLRANVTEMKAYYTFVILSILPFFGHGAHNSDREECKCKLHDRPDRAEKALTARWMVHSLDWGTLSTVSTRLGTVEKPMPFGNIYSFIDGTCENSTGIPYFYGTYMDQSFADTKKNEIVSLSLSEASLSSVCIEKKGMDVCTIGTKFGDPENPVCARLTITGSFVILDDASEEFLFAKKAMFDRHPTMSDWPSNHEWILAKIDIQDIWLIDFFGGATILSPEEYFDANLKVL